MTHSDGNGVSWVEWIIKRSVRKLHQLFTAFSSIHNYAIRGSTLIEGVICYLSYCDFQKSRSPCNQAGSCIHFSSCSDMFSYFFLMCHLSVFSTSVILGCHHNWSVGIWAVNLWWWYFVSSVHAPTPSYHTIRAVGHSITSTSQHTCGDLTLGSAGGDPLKTRVIRETTVRISYLSWSGWCGCMEIWKDTCGWKASMRCCIFSCDFTPFARCMSGLSMQTQQACFLFSGQDVGRVGQSSPSNICLQHYIFHKLNTVFFYKVHLK